MRISDWSSDVCSSDLNRSSAASGRPALMLLAIARGERGAAFSPRDSAKLDAAVFIISSFVHLSQLCGSNGQKARARFFRPPVVANLVSAPGCGSAFHRSEEHTSELQSLMPLSYAF